MRALSTLAMIAAALVVIGCGGEPPEDTVRSTWKTAASAAADGDGTRFCELVAPAGKRAITSRTQLPCEDSVRLLGATLSEADKRAIRAAKVTAVDVHGDDATVAYVINASLAKLGFTGRTALHRTDDRWLLLGV